MWTGGAALIKAACQRAGVTLGAYDARSSAGWPDSSRGYALT